jgi:hypothetical protein
MTQLTHFRDGLAPLMGTTPDAILNRQKKLHALMRAEAPDVPLRTGNPVAATPMNAAMVLLTVLDNGIIAEIPERMRRLWRAHISRRDKCPVTGAATLGQALTALIEQPKIRDKLNMIELAREAETLSLDWKHRDRPSVFYPDATAGEWARRVRHIRATGPVHLAQLDGSIFTRIADLIADHRKP